MSVTLTKKIYAASIDFKGGPHVSADRVARVFMRLADYVNEKKYVADGEAIWAPSIGALAHDLHLHRTAVVEALTALEVQGLIEPVGERSRGGRRTTWRITLEPSAYADSETIRVRGQSNGDQPSAYETQPSAYDVPTVRVRGHEPETTTTTGKVVVVVGDGTTAAKAASPIPGEDQKQGQNHGETIIEAILAALPDATIPGVKLMPEIRKALDNGVTVEQILAATTEDLPARLDNPVGFLKFRIRGARLHQVGAAAPTARECHDLFRRFDDATSDRWGSDWEGDNSEREAAWAGVNKKVVKALRLTKPWADGIHLAEIEAEWSVEQRIKAHQIITAACVEVERGRGTEWVPALDCEQCEMPTLERFRFGDRMLCRHCLKDEKAEQAAAARAEAAAKKKADDEAAAAEKEAVRAMQDAAREAEAARLGIPASDLL